MVPKLPDTKEVAFSIPSADDEGEGAAEEEESDYDLKHTPPPSPCTLRIHALLAGVDLDVYVSILGGIDRSGEDGGQSSFDQWGKVTGGLRRRLAGDDLLRAPTIVYEAGAHVDLLVDRIQMAVVVQIH